MTYGQNALNETKNTENDNDSNIRSIQDNSFCSTANPVCFDSIYQVPLMTNTSAESGPNYGCLYSQPNPVWYYFKISQSGKLTINISSPTGNDLDFACWGPFSDPITPCVTQLTANCTSCPNNTSDPAFYPSGNLVDCSYDPSYTENCHISNAMIGQYYILMITNYSNQPGDVTFYQSNYNDSSAALIACDILCNIDSSSITVGNCDSLNNYQISGTVWVTNPPSTGIFKIVDEASAVELDIPAPFNNTISFSMTVPFSTNSPVLNFSFSNSICSNQITYTRPLKPTLTVNTVSSTCGQSNGQIIVGITGNGIPNYSYIWSTGQSTYNTSTTISYLQNIPAGNYSVSVYNNNHCYTSQNFAFSDNGVPSIDFNLVQSNICPSSCQAILHASVNGTNFPYTYTWSNASTHIDSTGSGVQVDSLCNGIYFVTVQDANHCSSIGSFQVSSTNNPLNVSVSSIQKPTCINSNNGNISLTVTGGTPPYQYIWSTVPVQTTNIATNLSIGTYYYTVSDSTGCQLSGNVILNSLSNMSVQATLNNPTCTNNGSIVLQVQDGMPPYTYEWYGYTNNSNVLQNIYAGNYQVEILDNVGCTISNTYSLTNTSNSFTIDIMEIHHSCENSNNGYVIVQASGGVPPYYDGYHHFTSLDTLYHLSAGNHTFIFSDNSGCQYAQITQIQSLPVVTFDTTFAPPQCGYANGNITIYITSGTPPYSYQWSNGYFVQNTSSTVNCNNNLSAGVYTVTVTNGNGCTVDSTLTLTNNSLHLTTSIYNDCSNNCSGIATIYTNGTFNYPLTYHWSTGQIHTLSLSHDSIYNLCAGNYSVTVTDSLGCLQTTSLTIGANQSILQVMLNNANIPSCPGYSDGCATLVVTGGTPPYSYYWITGCCSINCCGLAEGLYNVTVSDNIGCSVTCSVYMPDGTTPNIGFTYSVQQNTVYFSNQSTQGSYIWTFGDGHSSTDINPIYTYSSEGIYNVCLTLFSCDTLTDCQQIILTDIPSEHINTDIAFEFSPNPCSNLIHITAQYPFTTNQYFVLTDILGKTVVTEKLPLSISNCTITFNLPEGLYFGQIIKDNKPVFIKKIINLPRSR